MLSTQFLSLTWDFEELQLNFGKWKKMVNILINQWDNLLRDNLMEILSGDIESEY